MPDYTTLYRFLRRVDAEVVTQALTAAVARLPPPTPEGMVVAVDATGFSPTAASRYFVDLTRNRGTERTRQHWPKWVVAVDVPRRVVLGQLAYAGPANASSTLRPVVDLARQTGRIGLVVADAEFDSERNHHHIRDHVGADSIIPAKRGKSTWQLHGIRAQMRANFPAARYRQRARWSRASSPPPSASSPHGRPVVCPSPSTSRCCSWASPTTSTAFVVRLALSPS